MKLAGWQRTWIVASLILAMLVAMGTGLVLPSEEPIREAWADAALNTVKERDNSEAWVSAWQVKRTLFEGLDNDAIIHKARDYAQASHARQVKLNPDAVPLMLLDIAVVDHYYSRQLAARRVERRKCMAYGGTVWLIMLVLGYGVGRSAAWVTRKRDEV